MQIVISLIPITVKDDRIHILLQKRLNKRVEKWYKTWEFPQGRIFDYDVHGFAKKKLKMETGLDIVKMDDGVLNKINVSDFDSFVKYIASSFDFSKDDEYAVFHFIVDAKGKCEDNEEAMGHQWIALENLSSLLMNDSVCDLNRAVIEKLAGLCDNKEFKQKIKRFL